MSCFFSLGGGGSTIKDEQHQHEDTHEASVVAPNSLHLVINDEIYNKGFDVWQQYYHLHPHRYQLHRQQQHDLGYAAGDSSTGTLRNSSNSFSANCNSNNLYDSSVMRQGGYGMVGGEYGSVGSGSGGGTNCQDCGNQAKKDCQYMRCRTCCKSRGFQCQTHVKSTWVPAAKRRERQFQLASLSQQQHNLGDHQLSLMMRGSGSGSVSGSGGAGGSDQNLKRLREDQHIIATAGGGGGGGVVVNLQSTHHQNISTEMGHFPAELSSPSVFRCVRVTAMGESEEQLAYQTAVNIGGHVFKGILYDHGPEGPYNHPGGGGDSSSAAGDRGNTQHQQLNRITSGAMGLATTTVNPNAASIDPSNIFPTPLNAFMVGTQFFPPPRS